MKELDAVIFDLGGVILDIDYKATEVALRKLIGPRSDDYYKQTKQSPLFDDFEMGHIQPEAFREGIRHMAGKSLSDQAIDLAWNAMLGGLPPARMEFVRDVAARRRVFLLSNTNAIHKAAFDQIVARDLPGTDFDGNFEAAYYSHLMGRRKPDPAIYLYVTKKHGLDPARTLFIDDNQSNVEGAQKAGLQGFHLEGELLRSPLEALRR